MPTDCVDSRFLLHFLLSKAQFLEGRAQGATVKGIKLDLLRSLEFPRLPISEQRRIAATLDKADGIRRKREHQIGMAEGVLTSLFQELFFGLKSNWPVMPLREVSELINGDRSKNYPSGKDLVSEGILFLNTKNISNSNLIFDNDIFITKEKFRSLTRGKLKRGDLVITLRGSIGQCAIFDSDHETGFINAQLMGTSKNAIFAHRRFRIGLTIC